jgi:WD40-like Beta Propeller Repeat
LIKKAPFVLTNGKNLCGILPIFNPTFIPKPHNPMKLFRLFILTTLAATAIQQFPIAKSQMPDTDIWLIQTAKEQGIFRKQSVKRITNRTGYDNQPRFAKDGKSLLFVSIYEDGQPDVFNYNIATGVTTPVTQTKTSEYSPTPVGNGAHFLTVRVSLDSVQSLWKYCTKVHDRAKPANPPVIGIGYFCRIKQKTLAFILGEPNTLELISAGGTHKTIVTDPGRCMLRVPHTANRVRYVQKVNGTANIMELNVNTLVSTFIAPCIEGSEDFAFMPEGTMIMGSAGQMFYWDKTTNAWKMWFDLRPEGVTDFYRVVASCKGDQIAIVTFSGKKP